VDSAPGCTLERLPILIGVHERLIPEKDGRERRFGFIVQICELDKTSLPQTRDAENSKNRTGVEAELDRPFNPIRAPVRFCEMLCARNAHVKS
jgi:hypothetical protein